MFKRKRSRRFQDIWVASVQSGDLKSVQNLLAQKGKQEIISRIFPFATQGSENYHR